MEHRCELAVRGYECDSYGHVNNAVYLHYLEHGRHEFLKANGVTVAQLQTEGYGLVVARVSIEYRKPLATDDLITIVTRPLRRSRIGGVLGQRIYRGDQLIADAEVTWVCVDGRGRPTRLPPEFDREGFTP